MAPGIPYSTRYKSRKGKKKGTSRKRKSTFSKAVSKIAKRAVLTKTEPKQRSFAINGGSAIIAIQLYHNSPILESVFRNAAMPVQGVADYQRVGDRINITRIEWRWMIGQKADRPNVNWKWWIVRVPKGTTYTYAAFFNNITGNILLDDPNPDTVTVLKKGTFQISRGNNVNGTDEITTSKRMYVNLRKSVKFGPADAATSHNLDDHYFIWAVYDAFGTATTDNLGYFVGNQTIHYRDP